MGKKDYDIKKVLKDTEKLSEATAEGNKRKAEAARNRIREELDVKLGEEE